MTNPRGFGAYSAIASAIQTQEGWFPGSTSYQNNNPGNLVASSWTQSQPGYVGVDANGFAIFDTYADGLAALEALIQNYASSGATIQSMMAAWAPAGQGSNNPTLYAQNVAAAAGLSPSDPVSAAEGGIDLNSITGIDLSSLNLDLSSIGGPVIPGTAVALGLLLAALVAFDVL